MIGWLFSIAGAVALFLLGVGGLVAPEASGRGYGVAAVTAEARAYVRATAARDIVLGAIILTLALHHSHGALAFVLAVSTIAAIVDAINAAGTRNVAIHTAGALILIVTAGLVATGR